MTEPEYWNHVEAVAIKFVDHELLPELRKGCTAMNRLMIKPLVAKLRAKVDGERVEDRTLTSLAIRKSKLYKTRAKLSNRLEDAPNQRKAAQISLEIDETQACIAEVQQQIRRAEAGVSIRPDSNTVDLPTTPLERRVRRQSLRSMRSRARKKLKTLEDLPNRRLNIKAINKLRERLMEIEAELKQLDTHGKD